MHREPDLSHAAVRFSPPARQALLWLAMATGGVCAGAILTGVASVAMAVRTWAEARRGRVWRANPGSVAAFGARAAADRLLWMEACGGEMRTQEEVVHLLYVIHQAARIGIARSAFKGSAGAPREALLTAAACVQGGLTRVEETVYDPARFRPSAVRPRALAHALGRGYWSAAARVMGDEAWGSAVLGRERARRPTTDLVALLVLGGLLWLTFLPVHLPWADAPSAPSMRWSLGALALLHLLAMTRRQGWVDGHDHRTAGAVLNAVLSLVGVPLPRARRDADPALPGERHEGGEQRGRADENTQR